jgi:DNA polymerase III alpha subunit
VENYPKKRWSTLSACLTDLAPTKKEGGGTSRANRSQTVTNEIYFLKNPPYDLSDDPSWVVDQEVRYLGCPVSMSKVETADTSGANTTCKEVLDGKTGKNLMVAGNVKRVSDYKITKGKSKGKTMAFLTIEDETCSLDSVIVFPDCRDKFQYSIYEGNNLLFSGAVSEQDNSFIVSNIFEI